MRSAAAGGTPVLVPATVAWPFLLRQREMAEARGFLAEAISAPRLLRVTGESGSGKSFLARELVARAAERHSIGAIVHLNVPPSDLEASEFLSHLEGLLQSPAPLGDNGGAAVSAALRRRWLRQISGPGWRREYFYNVVRELSGQIPIAGPFIKACLPAKLPSKTVSSSDPVRALRFLLQQSDSLPIMLVIDNIQFLPGSVRDLVEAQLPLAGRLFSLVIIERLLPKREAASILDPDGFASRDVHLGTATPQEVLSLVRDQLPEEAHVQELAEAIYRRSGGNLKSVWFQVKFAAARRAAQDGSNEDSSYQAVVQSLEPIDQLVLRVVVFLLGGLSICQMLGLIKAMHLHAAPEAVGSAIADLSALGLLVVNSRHHDRVRVEHEIVSQVVSELTPEDEKLELQAQLVQALTELLNSNLNAGDDADTLYDRLIGIVTEMDVRSSVQIQSHLVRFADRMAAAENYTYLSTLLRDSVCWDTLDILPSVTVRSLLDAAQKSSAFEIGLLATQKLKAKGVHASLAGLFEAKFLVQLFLYEEALQTLSSLAETAERRCIEFNILINLCEDERARQIARDAYEAAKDPHPSEHVLVVLRNCGHLFAPPEAYRYLEASAAGFDAIGRRFGVATALNNLGLVELAAGDLVRARQQFTEARRSLTEIGSSEVYQPLLNLSGLEVLDGRWARAERLLANAREVAPRSLPMDNIMFEYNLAALMFLRGRISPRTLHERVGQMHATARKTRDRRFIELLGWFRAELAEKLGLDAPAYAVDIVERMRSRAYVGTEIFVRARRDGGEFEVPYVMSPHWRY